MEPSEDPTAAFRTMATKAGTQTDQADRIRARHGVPVMGSGPVYSFRKVC